MFRSRAEDAENDTRINVKFKAWHDHWQVGQEVLKKEILWEIQKFGRKEEALAPRRVSVLGKASATEIGADGFHSSVCMDGCDRCCGKYLSCSTRWRCLKYGQQMRASPCFAHP